MTGTDRRCLSMKFDKRTSDLALDTFRWENDE